MSIKFSRSSRAFSPRKQVQQDSNSKAAQKKTEIETKQMRQKQSSQSDPQDVGQDTQDISQQLLVNTTRADMDIQMFIPEAAEAFMEAVVEQLSDEKKDSKDGILELIASLDGEQLQTLSSQVSTIESALPELASSSGVELLEDHLEAIKQGLKGGRELAEVFEMTLSQLGLAKSAQRLLQQIFNLQSADQPFSFFDKLSQQDKKELLLLFFENGLNPESMLDQAFLERVRDYLLSGIDITAVGEEQSLYELKKARKKRREEEDKSAHPKDHPDWVRSQGFISRAIADVRAVDLDRIDAILMFSAGMDPSVHRSEQFEPLVSRMIDHLEDEEERYNKSTQLRLSAAKRILVKEVEGIQSLGSIRFDQRTLMAIRGYFESQGNPEFMTKIDLLVAHVVILDHYQQAISEGKDIANPDVRADLNRDIQVLLEDIHIHRSVDDLLKESSLGFKSLAEVNHASEQILEFCKTFQFHPSMHQAITAHTTLSLSERISDFDTLSRAVLSGEKDGDTLSILRSSHDQREQIGALERELNDLVYERKKETNPFKKQRLTFRIQQKLKTRKKEALSPELIRATRMVFTQVFHQMESDATGTRSLEQLDDKLKQSHFSNKSKGLFAKVFLRKPQAAQTEVIGEIRQQLLTDVRTKMEGMSVSPAQFEDAIRAQIDDLLAHGSVQDTLKDWHSELMQDSCFESSTSAGSQVLMDQAFQQLFKQLDAPDGVRKIDLARGFHVYGKVPPIVSALIATQTGGVAIGAEVGADKGSHLIIEKHDSGAYQVSMTHSLWGKLGLNISAFDKLLEASGSVAGRTDSGYVFRFSSDKAAREFLQQLMCHTDDSVSSGTQMVHMSDSVLRSRSYNLQGELTVGTSVDLFDGFDFRHAGLSSDTEVTPESVLGLSNDYVEGGVNEDGVGITAFGIGFEASVTLKGEFETTHASNAFSTTKHKHKAVFVEGSAGFGMLSSMMDYGVDKLSEHFDLDSEGGLAVEIAYTQDETVEIEHDVTKSMVWRRGLHLNLNSLNMLTQAVRVGRGEDYVPLGMSMLLPHSMSHYQTMSPDIYNKLVELGQESGQSAHYKVVYELPPKSMEAYRHLMDPNFVSIIEVKKTELTLRQQGEVDHVREKAFKMVYDRHKEEAKTLLKSSQRVATRIEAYDYKESASHKGLETDSLAIYKYDSHHTEVLLGSVSLTA